MTPTSLPTNFVLLLQIFENMPRWKKFGAWTVLLFSFSFHFLYVRSIVSFFLIFYFYGREYPRQPSLWTYYLASGPINDQSLGGTYMAAHIIPGYARGGSQSQDIGKKTQCSNQTVHCRDNLLHPLYQGKIKEPKIARVEKRRAIVRPAYLSRSKYTSFPCKSRHPPMCWIPQTLLKQGSVPPYN